jgi:molybdopterin adenylyltransferase
MEPTCDTGRIRAISISEKKGIAKSNVELATLLPNWGIEGDAHAGNWHRQVSLLAMESIEKMSAKGLDVGPGAFAENITTEGIGLLSLGVGDRIFIGQVELEITQIGKECHKRCAIYEQAGDCVMPKEGLFAAVVKGGTIRVGDCVAPVSSTEPGEPNQVRDPSRASMEIHTLPHPPNSSTKLIR